jgi:hypothetical protein
MRGNGRVRAFGEAAIETAAAPIGQLCEWPGCPADGAYPAPRCRERLRDYRWFCLNHIRAYNAAWNYYSGMTESEVEADIRHDTVWNRPSWRLGSDPAPGVLGRDRIADPFGFFAGEAAGEPVRAVSEIDRALVVLDLRPPVTVAIVKARYKQLVKIHHPDANGGDKTAEERFKQISEAYRTVVRCLTS